MYPYRENFKPGGRTASGGKPGKREKSRSISLETESHKEILTSQKRNRRRNRVPGEGGARHQGHHGDWKTGGEPGKGHFSSPLNKIVQKFCSKKKVRGKDNHTPERGKYEGCYERRRIWKKDALKKTRKESRLRAAARNGACGREAIRGASPREKKTDHRGERVQGRDPSQQPARKKE